MIDNVVGQRPAIVRITDRLARIIDKNVRQQFSRNVLGVVRRVAARVLQFLREDADEMIIICRLSEEVLLFPFSREENCLQWSCTSVCLNPAVASFVHRASPNSDLVSAEF